MHKRLLTGSKVPATNGSPAATLLEKTKARVTWTLHSWRACGCCSSQLWVGHDFMDFTLKSCFFWFHGPVLISGPWFLVYEMYEIRTLVWNHGHEKNMKSGTSYKKKLKSADFYIEIIVFNIWIMQFITSIQVSKNGWQVKDLTIICAHVTSPHVTRDCHFSPE